MKRLIILIISVVPLICNAQEWVDPYQEPILIGGIDSLYTAIKKQTVFPECCLTGGKVYVQFKVDESGIVSEAKVLRSLCNEADSIAVEIVKTLKFNPAKHNDKPYEISKILSIPFSKKE